jgi:hypothetical protein
MAIGRHKFLHLGEAQPFQVLQADCHSSAASDIFVSGSPRIGTDSPVQAHSVLDNSASGQFFSRFGTLHAVPLEKAQWEVRLPFSGTDRWHQ